MDTIEKWVREQLEEGYSPEQIKISLQKSGYDPEIVDRILNIKQEDNIMAKKKTSKSEKFDVKIILTLGIVNLIIPKPPVDLTAPQYARRSRA